MKEEYGKRRAALMEEREPLSMVCIFSGSAPMRSADEAYPFSVDRSFYYLTGIDRENMVLVLYKDWNGTVREMLYIEPYDAFLAKWVGGRMRPEEAAAVSGIADVRDVAQLKGFLVGAIDGSRGMGKLHVWLDLWRYTEQQSDTDAHKLAAWLRERYPAVAIEDVFGSLAAMREIKSVRELELMARAQETTKNAIVAMLHHACAGMNETEIEGAFDFGLMRQGCREHAFPTIAAGGARATTLHYGNNDHVVEDNEMVLVDLGSAEQHYCADISRTFPVNGRYTERQKEIYNTVLEAQQLVIDTAAPGMTMGELDTLVTEFYESRLDDLGLRKNGRGVRDYYYHSVTHSLGLDTHDVTTERNVVLRPGMVITVEPGLYIEEEGIGVRIEDDILITEDGCVDLSADIPKTVEDIERIMAERE